MVEVGTIIKVNKKNQATVKFDRKAACEACNMCMKHKDDMSVTCVIKNNLNAQIGDQVEVEMGDRYVITAALIVYMIPLILSGISLLITRGKKTSIQVIVFTAMLVFGFIIVAIINKIVKNKKGFIPRMSKVVEKKED